MIVCGNTTTHFKVSEYLERIERAWIDIMEQNKPDNYKITLWLGLDGYQLDDDGEIMKITRGRFPEPRPKAPKPEPSPCMATAPYRVEDMCQCDRDTISELRAKLSEIQFQDALSRCICAIPQYPMWQCTLSGYGGTGSPYGLGTCCGYYNSMFPPLYGGYNHGT